MTISSEPAPAVPPVKSDASSDADKDELIPRVIASPKQNCHDKQLQRSSDLQANVAICICGLHRYRCTCGAQLRCTWCFNGFTHPIVLDA